MYAVKNKFHLFVLLLFLSVSNFSLWAQERLVTLNMKDVTLVKVIDEIKKQTTYQFFYEDKIAQTPLAVVSVKDATVSEALEKILKGTGITYSLHKKVFYLVPATESDKNPKQAPRKISGNVIDLLGDPLIGVSIQVPGTSHGTVTDVDGNFSLNVNEGDILKFSYVGYQDETVTVEEQSDVRIEMKESVNQINEVVVTALGIKREKRLLGYSIQEIKSDELNQAGASSVTGALQGKVAGLQMNVSPTGLNGSTKITIRGNSSLTDNNQPLWVVDGIPFNDNSNSGASLYGGVDRGGVSFDINPEDIESISVLKGPNAAALYGSRAANGVILITTKKGTKNSGFGAVYSGSFTWSEVASTLDMQDKYGQGSLGIYNPGSQYSFGPTLDGHTYTAWTGEEMPFQHYGNKLEDFFRTGFSQNHNVAIGNVTEKSNYRLSFGYLGSEGIFPGESVNRINIDLKSGMEINKYLSLDSKLSLSRTNAENRPLNGINGEIYQLLYVPNNIRLSDLKDHYVTEDGGQINWVGPRVELYNPYYVNYQYSNQDERWRNFGYFSMKMNFTSWLYATAKYGFDYYRTRIDDMNRSDGMKIPITDDSYLSREDNFFEHNMEFILFGNHTLPQSFQLNYSVGGNIMYGNFRELSGKSQNMTTKGLWDHNSAANPISGGGVNAVEQDFWERKTRSVFGTMQVAYDDYLALDLTGRADWSSTLPPASNPYIYPSVNLSYDFTAWMNKKNHQIPAWLTFAKMRLSYAQAGKDTDPYKTKDYVTYTQESSGPVAHVPKIKANPDLKSEMKTSYEAGLDLKFFRNRLEFDFTAYYSETKNQILVQPLSGGWDGKYINAGLVSNRGFELMIYTKPVVTKDFEFGLDINLARNVTMVDELADDVPYMSFNFKKDNLLVDVGAESGGKLGDIYANRAFLRDNQGNVIVRNGLPLMSNQRTKIGNIQPDLLMSVIPSFSYKRVFFTTLFDMKFGGDIVSMSESIATGFGTAKRTENREDVVFPGVNEDGTPNTTPVSAEKYYMSIGSKEGIAEEFLYDASYIRIKEMSLGYSFSSRMLKKMPFSSFKLSLVARNLCYLFTHTPGSSPEGGFDTTMYSQAIDFTAIPYTRSFGFSVNVGF